MAVTTRRCVTGWLVFFIVWAWSSGAIAASSTSDVSPDQTRAHSDTLSNDALNAIQTGTFEVVVRKLTKDSLTYERPLPLDLLPYTIRNDHYISMGTAFAIGLNRFVSAAHVMEINLASLYEDYALRNREGRVFKIDKILKYSGHRDFVVFSVKDAPATTFFETNTTPRINQKVYAVGNALGSGVVIRDGLYTSDTPEEQDGEWKWMRFSAAASPGNSGGPLLDTAGRLIGVIVRKSENENLNFALPIAEVVAAEDRVAVEDARLIYRIDNVQMTKTGVFRHTVPLPKTLPELRREILAHRDRFSRQLMLDLFGENRAEIFPNGKGAATLLHTNLSSVFPGLIAQDTDMVWKVYHPTGQENADLGANGRLAYGNMGNGTYFRLRKPDDVALTALYGDSKLLMDFILQGINFRRTVGPETIKIVSLGKAKEESVYTDAYQRKWALKIWPVEYSDQMVALLALPVPTGYAGTIRIVSAASFQSNLDDMKALADFIYLSYYGSLRHWREFLAAGKNHLPPAFADLRLDIDYSRQFQFRSPRLTFTYPATLMKVTEDSDLGLDFSYFQDGETVRWDISRIVVGEDKNSNVAFHVRRNLRPSKVLNDSFHNTWSNIARGLHPYNRTIYFDDEKTVISAVHTTEAEALRRMEFPFLYTLTYVTDGNLDQERAEERLTVFDRTLTIYERGRSSASLGGADRLTRSTAP